MDRHLRMIHRCPCAISQRIGGASGEDVILTGRSTNYDITFSILSADRACFSSPTSNTPSISSPFKALNSMDSNGHPASSVSSGTPSRRQSRTMSLISPSFGTYGQIRDGRKL